VEQRVALWDVEGGVGVYSGVACNNRAIQFRAPHWRNFARFLAAASSPGLTTCLCVCVCVCVCVLFSHLQGWTRQVDRPTQWFLMVMYLLYYRKGPSQHAFPHHVLLIDSA